MKRALASLLVINGATAVADPHPWIAPGSTDFRSPCPMMNTLANHGFLPRDGRNLTKPTVIKGLNAGLNFDPALGEVMFNMAIGANPEPNATFFTLDHLNAHNVLEHDASLSRSDAFFGNNFVFNQTVFDETLVYWTQPTIDAVQLANSKIAAQVKSRAFNPNYSFTAATEQFSLGEVAAPIVAFGDAAYQTVPRDLVTYFFINERLPTELGWAKRAEPVTLQNILQTTDLIKNATSLLTGSNTSNQPHQRRNMHGFDI